MTRRTRSTRLKTFSRKLLAWYKRHGRSLPWRETRDPYRILVSEIMLQQTQVDRVIPKYHQFLDRYPTMKELATAPLPEVKKLWYPLGYNIRPVRLRQIAKQVVERHDGQLPDTYDGLIAMDGIGRYTAGAVLSFAYEQDAPILDTNVARLLQRYFGLPADFKKSARVKNRLWKLAAEVIMPGKGYDTNQAMMDLGATVCTARRPKCGACALRRECTTYPHADAHAEHPGRARRR